jgi:hypothetical protein
MNDVEDNPKRSPDTFFLCGALSAEVQTKLIEDVSSVVGSLGAAAERCSQFVKSVDEALAWHEALKRSINCDSDGIERLKNLRRVADLVANHLRDLDWNTASVLAHDIWRLSGRNGPIPSVVPPSSFDADISKMRSIAQSAKRITSSVRKKRGGNQASPEMEELISNIAQAYASNFRERPSAAGEGIFRKLCVIIFVAACIPDPPEETRLTTILKKCHFDLPPLRRGRKVKMLIP